MSILFVLNILHRINFSTHSLKRIRYKLGLDLDLLLLIASLRRKALVARSKSGVKKVLVQKSKSLFHLKNQMTIIPGSHLIWNPSWQMEKTSVQLFLWLDSTLRAKEFSYFIECCEHILQRGGGLTFIQETAMEISLF